MNEEMHPVLVYSWWRWLCTYLEVSEVLHWKCIGIKRCC